MRNTTSAFILFFSCELSLAANPTKAPSRSESVPPSEGRIVGWGEVVVGTNECNLNYKDVATGSYHTLALKEDGRIVGWGLNRNDQLEVPFPNADFVAVSAFEQQSVALTSDGRVFVWGSPATPLPSSPSDIEAIAAGDLFVNALRANGEIISSQDGFPTSDRKFVRISASYHSLAVDEDGRVHAWGCDRISPSIDYGQCQVPGPNSDFVSVSAGFFHSLGLKSDGTIVGWGDNRFGQLNVPEPNSEFVVIAAGYASVGLKKDGTLVQWGNTIPLGFAQGSFKKVVLGYLHGLAIRSDGSIVGWGSNSQSTLDIPDTNSNFVSISGDGKKGLGLKSDGTVVPIGGAPRPPLPNAGFVRIGSLVDNCWGLRDDGTMVEWGARSKISLPAEGIVAVAPTETRTYRLRADGTLTCCIYPEQNYGFVNVVGGQSHIVGLRTDGSIFSSSSLGTIPNPNIGFVRISAGTLFSLALRPGGMVVGWPQVPAAIPPAPNSGFVAISAGDNHSLGLKENGQIVAWGDNRSGQLDIPEPNEKFLAISAGIRASLAIQEMDDCNGNGRLDSCDIDEAGILDVDGDRIPDECQVAYALDVRPGACPNVVDVGERRADIPVAILASRRVSIPEVSLESLMLRRVDAVGQGVAPTLGFRNNKAEIIDVAGLFEGHDCTCNRQGPDGLEDLLLRFPSRDLVRNLELNELAVGTRVPVALEGNQMDGTPIRVEDCLVVAGSH